MTFSLQEVGSNTSGSGHLLVAFVRQLVVPHAEMLLFGKLHHSAVVLDDVKRESGGVVAVESVRLVPRGLQEGCSCSWGHENTPVAACLIIQQCIRS